MAFKNPRLLVMMPDVMHFNWLVLKKDPNRFISGSYFWLVYSSCLTWQPRRKASCTDPGVGMSAWQLWAPSEQSAETNRKESFQYKRQNAKLVRSLLFACLWMAIREHCAPCWCQRSWCTARRSVWCRSAAPSPHGPPGRCLHEGWSLKRCPRGEGGTWIIRVGTWSYGVVCALAGCESILD